MIFHNPYHFVPVPEESGDKRMQTADFRAGRYGHISHAGYAGGKTGTGELFHGRIVCRLTTETPTFFGGAGREVSTDETIGTVDPFELDGRRAIPASSLRGCISSIVETASNSALRILENRPLSCRHAMADALGAVGMLKEDKNGTLKLLPLTLPVFQFRHRKRTKGGVWKKAFPRPALPIHLGEYKRRGRQLQVQPGSFLATGPKSFSNSNQEYWYMKISAPFWQGEFLQEPGGEKSADAPIPEETYKKLSAEDQKKYVRGVLRILGIQGREGEIPAGKTKELFLSLPETELNPLLEIAKPLAVFNRLAADCNRQDSSRPWLPVGRKAESAESFALREHDLVYFTLDSAGRVSELAISSIWRKDLGMVYDYFPAEQLPFTARRKSISAAELLFGFVESREKGAAHPESALAFAGRLRFSHGRNDDLSPVPTESSGALKILASPKPPSPALYFTAQQGQYSISKENLNPDLARAQGRKFYLHHPVQSAQETPEKRPFWETAEEDERRKQKVKIAPIQAGVSFWFDVEFDNLNSYELGLLLYALQPSPQFRHKMGMGKPFGLGTVQIEPVALQLVDRTRRYLQDDIFSAPRYGTEKLLSSWKGELPQRYRQETKVEQSAAEVPDIEAIRTAFAKTMPQQIDRALTLLGEPHNVKHPVHYPLRTGQTGEKELEREGYKWFVENDNPRTARQQLAPLTGNTLPELKRN